MYHGPRSPYDSSVLPFSYPILLWSVWNGELSPNALTSTEVNKLLVCILTTVVLPQYFNFSTYLISYQSFEIFETPEDVTLGLQKENPSFPGEVIYENNIVLITSQRNMRHPTANI